MNTGHTTPVSSIVDASDLYYGIYNKAISREVKVFPIRLTNKNLKAFLRYYREKLLEPRPTDDEKRLKSLGVRRP